MKGGRSLGILIVIMLIFLLMLTVTGGLAKGVKEGRTDPKMLAGAVAALVIMAAVSLLAAVISLLHRKNQHVKRTGSADILADIMAIKDDDKKDKEEQ